MIITQAPLRITLSGGSSDLPIYTREHEGCVHSMAIDKYVYVILHESYDDLIRLKYSKYEEVKSPLTLENDVARAVLTHFDSKGLEIASFADIPTRTGLGSSGAYTVALIKALKLYYTRSHSTPDIEIIKTACEIEATRGGGYQDPSISELGDSYQLIGNAYPTKITQVKLGISTKNILLFDTGIRRDASNVLQSISIQEQIKNIQKIRDIGIHTTHAIKMGNLNAFGKGTSEQWETKKQLSPLISTPELDALINRAEKVGSLGTKIAGAGGGGFLFIVTTDANRERIINEFSDLKQLDFNMSLVGCRVIYDDSRYWRGNLG